VSRAYPNVLPLLKSPGQTEYVQVSLMYPEAIQMELFSLASSYVRHRTRQPACLANRHAEGTDGIADDGGPLFAGRRRGTLSPGKIYRGVEGNVIPQKFLAFSSGSNSIP
jgi:hypothetical protein